MFTGIVQAVGTVMAAEEQRGADIRLSIGCPDLGLARCRIGDSIALSGVCLTAVAVGADSFAADVSRETLNSTNLGALAPGDAVNLERSLAAGDPLGGHLVTGHVDATASVLGCRDDARSVRIEIELPARLAPFVAAKGSVCVDGVSLTVNGVSSDRFDVNVVPHTLAATTMADYGPGTQVNLEVDLVARYLYRMLETSDASHPGQSSES